MLRIQVLIVPLLLTSVSLAECKWDSTEAEVTGGVREQQIHAKFTCTNTGDFMAKIGSIKPSCGCTTASVSKTSLYPGEYAIVDVIIDTGNQVGEFRKSVAVEIDSDNTTHNIVLTIKVDIINPLTITPIAVTWKKGDVAAHKKIHVKCMYRSEIHIRSIESSHQAIETSVTTVKDGSEYDIDVWPSTTEKPFDATLLIHTDLKTDGPEKRFAFDASVE